MARPPPDASNRSGDGTVGRGAVPARVAIPIPMVDPSLSLLRRWAAGRADQPRRLRRAAKNPSRPDRPASPRIQ